MMVNKKYDGNSVLLYFPLEKMKGGIVLPKKGKHCLVFEMSSVSEEKIMKLIEKREGEMSRDENEERIVISKGNVSVYLCKKSRMEMNDIDESVKEKFTLKNIVDTVCDRDLAFSRLQDKGMVWLNALILCVLFIITYGCLGCSMRTKQLKQTKEEKKE